MTKEKKTSVTAGSFFETQTLSDLHEDIRATYLCNDLPWVIGYSGGKDSTATLQVLWEALAELAPEARTKPIHVISSDTLVETPNIVDYIDSTLEKVEAAAKDAGIPIETQKVVPEISDTFWVNIIGRGYPAPSTRFRWCTERMKIRPANKYILDVAAKHGEVVMVLGARRGESTTRDQVLNDASRRIPGTRLTRHSELARAYVYTPIEDWSIDDVWTYLLSRPSPWGGNNRDLAAMYRNTDGGECPLVVDTSTPSCGNSRFGCWTCTVVTKEKAIAGLIDSGEKWLIPLQELREQLVETQIPERKREFRDYKRRDGRVYWTKENKIIPGPYKFSYRKQLLRDVLSTQRQVREETGDHDLSLIRDDELKEIRRIWRQENSDWDDSVPAIYKDVMETDIAWLHDEVGGFDGKDHALLQSLCEKDGLPVELITRLIDVEIRKRGMGRRTGIFAEIGRIVNEEWDDETSVTERRRTETITIKDLDLD